MKAVGNNILIRKAKEETISKTEGGLLLTGKQKQDLRYKQATVINFGDLVNGLKEGDEIYYDMHAGHRIEIDNDVLYVITIRDVVVVL
jgi:co-chaperonin GroES (HSP10)